jgi:hypothetical protein
MGGVVVEGGRGGGLVAFLHTEETNRANDCRPKLTRLPTAAYCGFFINEAYALRGVGLAPSTCSLTRLVGTTGGRETEVRPASSTCSLTRLLGTTGGGETEVRPALPTSLPDHPVTASWRGCWERDDGGGNRGVVTQCSSSSRLIALTRGDGRARSVDGLQLEIGGRGAWPEEVEVSIYFVGMHIWKAPCTKSALGCISGLEKSIRELACV